MTPFQSSLSRTNKYIDISIFCEFERGPDCDATHRNRDVGDNYRFVFSDILLFVTRKNFGDIRLIVAVQQTSYRRHYCETTTISSFDTQLLVSRVRTFISSLQTTPRSSALVDNAGLVFRQVHLRLPARNLKNTPNIVLGHCEIRPSPFSIAHLHYLSKESPNMKSGLFTKRNMELRITCCPRYRELCFVNVIRVNPNFLMSRSSPHGKKYTPSIIVNFECVSPCRTFSCGDETWRYLFNRNLLYDLRKKTPRGFNHRLMTSGKLSFPPSRSTV